MLQTTNRIRMGALVFLALTSVFAASMFLRSLWDGTPLPTAIAFLLAALAAAIESYITLRLIRFPGDQRPRALALMSRFAMWAAMALVLLAIVRPMWIL
jgi:hypothetical protein